MDGHDDGTEPSRGVSSRGISPHSVTSPGQQKLSKRDVETLLADYDADPVAALTVALSLLSTDPTLLSALPSMPLPDLDALVKDLVEWRQLPPAH